MGPFIRLKRKYEKSMIMDNTSKVKTKNNTYE